MESITRFITRRLKLVVNEAKSAVARPWERKLLGFSLYATPRTKAPDSATGGEAVQEADSDAYAAYPRPTAGDAG